MENAENRTSLDAEFDAFLSVRWMGQLMQETCELVDGFPREASWICATSYAVLCAHVNERGFCAVCGRTCRLVRDHDHANGFHRARLCHDCNLSRGDAGETPALLIAKAGYVQTWQFLHANGYGCRKWLPRPAKKVIPFRRAQPDPRQRRLF